MNLKRNLLLFTFAFVTYVAAGALFYEFQFPGASLQQAMRSDKLLAQVTTTPEQEVDRLIDIINQLSNEVINLPVGQSSSPAVSSNGSGVVGECVELTRVLGIGSQDTATDRQVSTLQRFLIAQGYLSANATGYYGELTAKAVKQFQVKTGLASPTDPVQYSVGPQTRAKVKEISCGTSGQQQNQSENAVRPTNIQNNSVTPTQTNVGTNSNGGTSPIRVELASRGTDNPTRGWFGTVSLSETKDMTVEISVEPGKTVQFNGFTGLTKPFQFKGGAYPGIGGTCRETISDRCTIVVTFLPNSQLGVPYGADQLRVSSEIIFNFIDSNKLRGQTKGFVLYAYTPNRATSFTISGQTDGRNTIKIASVRVGLSARHEITLTSTSEAKDIKVTTIQPPFYGNPIECKKITTTNSIILNQCVLVLEYKPTAAGTHSQNFSIEFNDAIETRVNTFTVIGEAFGGSDLNLSPERNLLIVYNEKSADGKRIADYYTNNRPGFSTANVIAVRYPEDGCGSNCPSPDGETSTIGRFNSTIRDPIARWIKEHPQKDIRHIVLVRGIPTRVQDPSVDVSKLLNPVNTNSSGFEIANYYQSIGQCKGYTLLDANARNNMAYNPNGSCFKSATEKTVGYFSPQKYPGMLALVTSLDMGSTDATLRYIDKLNAMYNRMPVPSIFISSQGTGKAGTTYYVEDVGGRVQTDSNETYVARNIRDYIQNANPSVRVDYRAYKKDDYLRTLSDVAGLFTWGFNGRWNSKTGYDPDYALNGSITMTGNSGWYLIQTAESFNGKLDSFQGSYRKWFSQKAFGGTNYENTPVAAVAHVDEPLLSGINDRTLFQCWEKGDLFIDCAWYSRQSDQALTIGDPWIRK